MSSDMRLVGGDDSVALGAEAAEHERQFREMLEFCPAALLVVDEDGRLLFHNARLREISQIQQRGARPLRHPQALARPRATRADH
jgi:PAS domain-containing protein